MAENMDDMSTDPEFKAWAAHLVDEVIPKMKGSAMTISLAPSPESESDIKYAVELGLSIMLDKPIVILAMPGQVLPEKLRRVADRIIEVDWRKDPNAGQKAIADVIESMLGDKS